MYVYGIRGFKLATMSSGRRAEAGSSRGESTKPAMRAVVQSRSPWVALFGSRKVPEADESVACLPAAALNQEQVNMATKMEELALAAVVNPPVRARAPEQVRGTIEPLLVQFTQSFSGVPDAIGLASQLKLNVSKSDPGVYTSWPRGAKSAFKSGGPCPTHQDYSPSRETDGERSYTFIMLLQDTAASNGATYVYPGSRLLQQRMEPISLPKPAHRPSKKRKRKAVQPGDLNPHVLDQSGPYQVVRRTPGSCRCKVHHLSIRVSFMARGLTQYEHAAASCFDLVLRHFKTCTPIPAYAVTSATLTPIPVRGFVIQWVQKVAVPLISICFKSVA